jgi:undecaprenyl-diphosphatase
MSIIGIDHELASWFHAHLNTATGPVWQTISFAGGGTLMWITLVSAVVLLAFMKRWQSLVTLVLTVPGGILAGEGLKLLVQRHRPYLIGPFVDWAGYSFPSGHAISATLLYGFTCLALWGVVRAKHWRALSVCVAAAITLLVGLSRIALGAHYLTDVLGGFIVGLSWLTGCLMTKRVIVRRFIVARAPQSGEERAALEASQ